MVDCSCMELMQLCGLWCARKMASPNASLVMIDFYRYCLMNMLIRSLGVCALALCATVQFAVAEPDPTATPTVTPTATATEVPTVTPTVTRTATATPTGLDKVCKTKLKWQRYMLYKYQASGHLGSSDRAKSCSLIYGKANQSYPRLRYLPLYNIKGKLLGTFINYAMGGSIYAARWYTAGAGPSCATIAATAKKQTKSYGGYIGVGSKKCFYVPNLTGRYGSVK